MNEAELERFINDEPRFATLATMRRAGTPITDGIGIEWDDGALYFSVRDTRAMMSRLKREPRVSVHLMNQTYPPMWVRLEGTVEPVDDPGLVRTMRIMRRYMDPASPAQTIKTFDMETFERSYMRAGRTMYRLRPDVIRSHDANKYGDGAHEQMGGAGVSDSQAAI
jgi:PPOX class probable F420-dependent enzyme